MYLHTPVYQVETQAPVFRLKIASSCEVYSDEIKLPPFYHEESQYGRIKQENTLLSLQNSCTFTLWCPFDNFNNNNKSICKARYLCTDTHRGPAEAAQVHKVH